MKKTVVILCESGSLDPAVVRAIEQAGFIVHPFARTADGLRVIGKARPDAVLVFDAGRSEGDASAVLQLAKQCAPNAARILCPQAGATVACADADAVVSLERLGSMLHQTLQTLSRRDNGRHREALMMARGMVRALAMRQVETVEHSLRLAAWARYLGSRCGASEQQLRDVELGGLLHDIGKVGVADRILLKPGSLSSEEWSELRRHPALGAEMVRDVPLLSGAMDVVLFHHERWDGKGYPHGLRSRAIPETARIFAVCDAYEAITSDRPHRPAPGAMEARRRIETDAGTHFDLEVVEAFVAIDPTDWLRVAEEAVTSGGVR